jgi:plastocyanin
MRHTFQFAILSAAVAVALVASRTSAEEWGTLKGKFIYDGKPAAPAPIDVTKDPEVCGNKGLVSEELVVDEKTGAIANVMLWVKGKDFAVHPDYEKTASGTVVLDNKGCRFEPHVQGIRVGQTLQLHNSDPVAHNTNVQGRNNQINPLIPAQSSSDQKIDQAEILPALVSCNIHPWMKGRLIVRPNPYFAVSKKDGTFEIKNLPAGDLEFVVYHERSGYVTDAEVKGEKVNWPKGVMKITIKAGDEPTDLGEIKLSAAQFNK